MTLNIYSVVEAEGHNMFNSLATRFIVHNSVDKLLVLRCGHNFDDWTRDSLVDVIF
jgi:hypothetical protein